VVERALLALGPSCGRMGTPVAATGAGGSLSTSGDGRANVYFPTISIISLPYVMEDRASGEISIVGNEGVIGVAIFTGAKRRHATRSFKARATRTVSTLACPGRSFFVVARRSGCYCDKVPAKFVGR
jgi:hypothetical protein